MVKLTIKILGPIKWTFKKEAPSVDDWYKSLGAEEELEGKNLFTDINASKKATELVADYLKIPKRLIKKAPVADIMKAYYTGQKEIVQALAAASEVWGKNVEPQER